MHRFYCELIRSFCFAQQSRTSSPNSHISHTSCTTPGPGITRPETRTANNWCWHFHRGVEHLCLQVGSIPIRIWHGRPIYPVPIVPMCRTYTLWQPTKGQPTCHLAATRRPSPCHAFTSGEPSSHLCLMHWTSSDAPRMGWSIPHLFHTSMWQSRNMLLRHYMWVWRGCWLHWSHHPQCFS